MCSLWACAEALYYCSDAIEAVAHRQAESLGFKADEVIELAKTEALAVLKQNGLAERMAAKRSQRQLQDQDVVKTPTAGKNSSTPTQIQISSYMSTLPILKS